VVYVFVNTHLLHVAIEVLHHYSIYYLLQNALKMSMLIFHVNLQIVRNIFTKQIRIDGQCAPRMSDQYCIYLNMPFMPGTGEIFVICAALIGAGLGFLWFNTYPAEIFMGDVGSLSLGAILAVIAIIIRQEVLLFIMGGVFVAETLSVIIQVGWYKRTKTRVFLMAPLHHHFEKKGLSEPKIIVRFWMVTLILVMISLASIKIR